MVLSTYSPIFFFLFFTFFYCFCIVPSIAWHGWVELGGGNRFQRMGGNESSLFAGVGEKAVGQFVAPYKQGVVGLPEYIYKYAFLSVCLTYRQMSGYRYRRLQSDWYGNVANYSVSLSAYCRRLCLSLVTERWAMWCLEYKHSSNLQEVWPTFLVLLRKKKKKKPRKK